MKIKIEGTIYRDLPEGVRCVRILIGCHAHGIMPRYASTRQKKLNRYFEKLSRFKGHRRIENYVQNHTPQRALRQFCNACGNGYGDMEIADIRPEYLCGTKEPIGINVYNQRFDGQYIGGSWEFGGPK